MFQRGRRWRVPLPFADSNLARVFFIVSSILIVFFHIIIIVHYNNEWRAVVQWQGRCSKSNRTWVRSPGPPICILLFFSRYSSAFQELWGTILPQSITCQMAPGQIWWSRMNAYHEPKSARMHGSRKGQRRPTQMGLELTNQTPKSRPKP